MTAQRDQKLARELAARAKECKQLTDGDLDQYLRVKRGYDRRVELLIEKLGDLPLVSNSHAESVGPGSGVERPRIPAVADDDNLRRYLRQVSQRRKLDKSEEITLARRLEFARRRFQKAVLESRVHGDHLREVLGEEFSRTYAQDLEAPLGTQTATASRVGQGRRHTIQARASELNRIRSYFVERNLPLVVDLALCYRTYGIPVMDLIQEGNGALIRAVEKFDWRKDVRFQTYATFWIRQAIERAIAFNKGIVRVPNYLQQKMRRLRREGVLPRRDRDVSVREVSAAFAVKPEVAGHLLQTERTHFSLDVAIDDDGETFASLLADEGTDANGAGMEFPLLRSRLGEVLGTLSGLEREILELRFGLNGQSPLTLEEVGRRMSVSRERIRQLQVRAIRKLQRPGLIQRLAGFV
jgi:RNA polymerase primary sigma factor